MRYLLTIITIAGIWLIIPIRAQAQNCYQAIQGKVECDSCGNYEAAYVCQGFHSSGGSTCNFCQNRIPCQNSENNCFAEFCSATVTGSCTSAAASLNQPLGPESVLMPNDAGGYSETAIPTYSYRVREGRL
jgi:hypothetical protein